jgi:hypothetical protein
MVASLADRLSAARHRQFVGRSAELSLFQSAFASAELPFQILYIFGPGGIGKTTLLREFALACAGLQSPVYYLDARNIDPTPESFLDALRLALGLAPADSPFQILAARSQPQALLIDTYETLAPLDNWLRDVFMPQLPENTLVVLAGRTPPSDAWKADPGWQTLIRTVPLRNLSPDESRSYLAKRAVPSDQHRAILDFTHGHALALSLVADVLAQRHETRFEPEASPDVVRALLERFVQKVPGPAHRAALEACALVRVTTEALLGQMLTQPAATPLPTDPVSAQGAHELFEWLRTLSFIESGREGLFPHDLARETLVADLRWRNPDWYAELHRRARNYYAARTQQTRGVEQQRILFDYVFLHRDNPAVRSMLEWQTGGTILPGALRDADRAELVTMVAAHEGAESARLAEQWLARQPEGVTVYRDEEGRAVGFIAMVALNQAKLEEVRDDPATRLAWEYLQRTAPLRAGEIATHYRFWMARDTYQSVSSVQTLIFLNTVRYQLTTPGLAYHFLPCADPDFWAPAFAYANLTRLLEADYEIGGKRYGVYGHDWRAEPPLAWLALLAEREIGTAPAVAAPPTPPAPLIVLSESEFSDAVQDALRNYTRAGALRGNPLLRSRFVVERAGAGASETEREAALQALLKEAVESLQSSPREVKLYRALYHTFLKPEPTQERAAEVMDVPFSTYRRHLKAGVTRVVQLLWQGEIGTGELK